MSALTTAEVACPEATSETARAGQKQISSGVSGVPRLVLRAEGAAVLIGAVLAYAHLGAGWGLFAALFLVPDLSFLGYLAGLRVGAITYNTAHSYLGPAALALASLLLPAALPIAAIWAAHVGFDRMLGYGLKYATAFGDTHLGRVGRRRAAQAKGSDR